MRNPFGDMVDAASRAASLAAGTSTSHSTAQDRVTTSGEVNSSGQWVKFGQFNITPFGEFKFSGRLPG